MDRLQKALDKAKIRNLDDATKASSEKKLTPRGEDPLKNVIDEIQYTQTRVERSTHDSLEQQRIISNSYSNSQSPVFRMLRTQVLQKMRSNGWQSIAITSPTAGEGKSLVSSNLAVAMAMESNQTILLVDLDLRNPSIAKYFGVDVKYGLKNYLESDITLPEILFNPNVSRLVVLPGKGRAEHSAELISSAKMADLVSELKSKYNSRMIIFDVPPILQTDDVLMSSDYFDCILLVLEDGKNKEADIIKSMQLLDGQNLIGTVLNKSERPPTHQNY